MDFGTSRRRFPFHPPRPIPKAYEAPKPARSLDSRILKATLSHEEPKPVAVSQADPQPTSNRDPIVHNLNVPHRGSDYASAAASQTTYSREHVRVAICCALPLEADAVQAVFDTCLDDDDLDQDKMRSSSDTNSYNFGIIGRHFTVLVHMPGMGRTNGAIVATKCQASFPNIKLALVVGICGGLPFYGTEKKEIILGDVVISEGLYGYDFGSRFPDEFVVKNSADDVFARPSPQVRSILRKLKSRHNHRKLQLKTHEYLRQIQRDPENRAHYPGAKEDQLFAGTYAHMHRSPGECNKCSDANTIAPRVCLEARSSTCGNLACDNAMLVTRSRLNVILDHPAEARPMIHFGKVACGDQVMKSGNHRDAIGHESGAIAFEMEGAGIWDSFSCLVIKGVCDYADSHKHKKWQSYAAATAAACAKAFLQECYM
ncbi:hypothetical protein GQ607_007874 [Colletotrichum asianum]|uniref:Nucleoside phosphorylase domain-containing protein n=1 Tax=Colletotrichum asianum TaxID=702518 RepID=A0A8H3WFV4_9PEZI|nr:hypothetical protein GQ607_007874 [Colletotrichum asianum]